MIAPDATFWQYLLDPFELFVIPFDVWVDELLNWIVTNYRGFFQAIRWPIDKTLVAVEGFLQALPPLLVFILTWLIGWQVSDRNTTFFVLASMIFIGFIDAWSQAITTLSLVLTSVFFCTLTGIPLGIIISRS